MLNRLRASADEMRRHTGGLAKFGAVGVGNVFTEFLVFGVLLHLGLAAVAANAVGFLCANVQSYVVNAHVTFRRNGAAAPVSLAGYRTFFLAHCLSLAISTGFIIVLGPQIGPFPAKAAAVVFGFLANYSMSALFVFGKQDREGALKRRG